MSPPTGITRPAQSVTPATPRDTMPVAKDSQGQALDRHPLRGQVRPRRPGHGVLREVARMARFSSALSTAAMIID